MRLSREGLTAVALALALCTVGPLSAAAPPSVVVVGERMSASAQATPLPEVLRVLARATGAVVTGVDPAADTRLRREIVRFLDEVFTTREPARAVMGIR